MKAILLILALAACSTPVHECVQKLGPDPIDMHFMSSGAAGGVLAQMFYGDDPAHLEWQKKYDACMKERGQ